MGGYPPQGQAKTGLMDTDAALINPSVERELNEPIATTADLNGGAYSGTTSIAGRFRLESVHIHLSAATSPTITVTLRSKNGAAYDTVLASNTLSSDTDYVAVFGSGYEYANGDEIKVDVTSVAATAGIVVKVSKGGRTA